LSVKRYIPPNIPLVDDNSEFNLLGYKNFLLEPKVRTALRRFKEENPGPLPCNSQFITLYTDLGSLAEP
jgi:hypothetical protein